MWTGKGGLRRATGPSAPRLDWRFCEPATLSTVPGAGTDTKSIFLALGYRLGWGGGGGLASVSIRSPNIKSDFQHTRASD